MHRTRLLLGRALWAALLAVTTVVATLGVLAAPASGAPPLPGPTPPPAPPVTTPPPSAPVPLPGPAPAPSPAPTPPSTWPVKGRPHVLMFGDSLAWEAKDLFSYLGAVRGADVRTFTFGGTAICDFLTQMKDQAASFQPQAVVVAFTGNNLTPCMSSAGVPLQDQGYYDRYTNDVSATMALFPQSVVYWVGAPALNRANPTGDLIVGLYRAAPSKWTTARFVDGGEHITPGGVWSKTQPCLPVEPCVGPIIGLGRVNVVRAPDGAHFCPVAHEAVNGVVQACPVYSSGAYRYALSMLLPVLAQLHL